MRATERLGQGESDAVVRTRIAVASADPSLRLQLRRLLPSAKGFEMVGAARFGAALRETLSDAQPHTLIVDARQNPVAASAALEMARTLPVRSVLLLEEGQLAVGPAAVVLACPAEIGRERAEDSFARNLLEAARRPDAEVARERCAERPDRDPTSPGGPRISDPAAPGGTRTSDPTVPGGPRTSDPAAPASPAVSRAPQRVAAMAARRAEGAATLHPLAPKPEVIAFGSSTGGPQALLDVFRALRGPMPLPMLLTQHMPPRFTGMLAQQITQVGHPACEAEQGMPLRPGHVYVAPGGQHLTVERRDKSLICALDDGAPENFCKPSVDVMIRSVARACGGRCLAIILTGMGSDGLIACRQLFDAGGTVIAQDEASSVVWGMPGAVATAGICRAVLPLRDIAPAIALLVPR